jgi:hypothetical protein
MVFGHGKSVGAPGQRRLTDVPMLGQFGGVGSVKTGPTPAHWCLIGLIGA